MSNETMSVQVREWSAPLEEGQTEGDWPGPDKFAEYLITGHLADLIRERTGETGDVLFEQCEVEGGYSEWTVEYDYEVTIKVGVFRRKFDGSVDFAHPFRSAIPAIQQWLEESS